MGQTARFQETLRRLAMIDEGFAGDAASPGSQDRALLAIALVAGRGRVVCAAPDVAIAFEYDVADALEEPDDYR